MSLKGRTALVTGSTSGIGQGIAKALAANGCSVIVSGSRCKADAAEALTDIESGSTGKVYYVQSDLKNSNNVEDLCTEVDSIFPDGVDILVNNAGAQHIGLIEEQTLESWNTLLTVNLTAPFILTRHVVPKMKKKGWGRIINVSSVMALFAMPKKVPYVASKTGMVGLTRAVALETAPHGITCNAICPAWVDTPLVAPQVQMYADKSGQEFAAAKEELFLNATPTKKVNKPSQIADLCVFLCSPGASNMTGTSIPVDGGMSIQ